MACTHPFLVFLGIQRWASGNVRLYNCQICESTVQRDINFRTTEELEERRKQKACDVCDRPTDGEYKLVEWEGESLVHRQRYICKQCISEQHIRPVGGGYYILPCDEL